MSRILFLAWFSTLPSNLNYVHTAIFNGVRNNPLSLWVPHDEIDNHEVRTHLGGELRPSITLDVYRSLLYHSSMQTHYIIMESINSARSGLRLSGRLLNPHYIIWRAPSHKKCMSRREARRSNEDIDLAKWEWKSPARSSKNKHWLERLQETKYIESWANWALRAHADNNFATICDPGRAHEEQPGLLHSHSLWVVQRRNVQ